MMYIYIYIYNAERVKALVSTIYFRAFIALSDISNKLFIGCNMIENGNQFLPVRASHAQIRKLLLLRQPSPTLRMQFSMRD